MVIAIAGPHLLGEAPWTPDLVPEGTRPVTTKGIQSGRDLRGTVPYLSNGSWTGTRW